MMIVDPDDMIFFTNICFFQYMIHYIFSLFSLKMESLSNTESTESSDAGDVSQEPRSQTNRFEVIMMMMMMMMIMIMMMTMLMLMIRYHCHGVLVSLIMILSACEKVIEFTVSKPKV